MTSASKSLKEWQWKLQATPKIYRGPFTADKCIFIIMWDNNAFMGKSRLKICPIWIIKSKAVEGLGTLQWNGILVLDFLPNWTIFFHYYMVEWSLSNKKLSFLLIIPTEIRVFTKPCGSQFEAAVLTKSSYYRGSPTYTKITNTVSTTVEFGL